MVLGLGNAQQLLMFTLSEVTQVYSETQLIINNFSKLKLKSLFHMYYEEINRRFG